MEPTKNPAIVEAFEAAKKEHRGFTDSMSLREIRAERAERAERAARESQPANTSAVLEKPRR